MTAEFKISRLRYTWAGPWSSGDDYNRDAVVSFGGKTWVCLEPHTSTNFEADLTFSDPILGSRPRWSLMIDGKSWFGEWTPGTDYFPGNIVLYSGTVYVAVTYATSGSVFNPTNWTQLVRAEKWNNEWAINTAYGLGDVVKYGAIVYRCVFNHLSAATTTAGLEVDQSKWEILYKNIEYKGQWLQTSVRYRVNDVVTNGSDLWICVTGHTSTTTFDQDVWDLWLPGIDFKTDWQANSVYQPGDTVTYGGYSYVSNIANNQNINPSTNSAQLQPPAPAPTPPAPGEPTYSITPSVTSLNESGSVTFNVTTLNVADGTTLYWSTQQISGTINANDFTDGQLSGSVTINSNSGSIIRSITSDSLTEGSESFRIQIRTVSISGSVVATSSTVSINDTSTTPAGTLYTVTVANGTNEYGTGNKYYIAGLTGPSPTLNLIEGQTYIFDQGGSSNTTHQLLFSTTPDGTWDGGVEYTTGVTKVGTAGQVGAYTQITVPTDAPTLYYYCINHSGMGGTANTPAPESGPGPEPEPSTGSFAVTSSGSSAYIIDTVSNPNLTLYRGWTYTFTISASGHPFWIKTAAVTGTGSAYSTGVTGNGTESGTLTFVVPLDAPSTLYYICQFHGSMQGAINISNAAPLTITPLANSDPLINPISAWRVLTEGYKVKTDWDSSDSYQIGDVIRRGGNLFVAKIDSIGEDPVGTQITVAYDSDASTGRTLVVDDTTGIVPGMILLGPDFTLGQVVSEVIDATTLLVSDAPAKKLGATVTFIGINDTNWTMLVPGVRWSGYWRPTPVEREFLIGDIVVWKNATYRCIQNHTVQSGTRPDLDVTGQYWTIYVLHERRNATETFGDLVVFSSAQNNTVALPIGAEDLNLRKTAGFPAWKEILVIEKVYYVTNVGTDDPTYGKSIDKPWRTIRYACQQIDKGDQYVNTGELLRDNKDFIATEVYEYLVNQSITTEEYSTKRDARYIVDALAYDLSRGGNSQIVAATLAYFSLKNNDTFINSAVDAQMPSFLTALNYLRQLVSTILSGGSPNSNYQELNNQWNIGNSYSLGDVVFYDGDWYESLIGGNSGNQPDTLASGWSVTVTPAGIELQQAGPTAEPDSALEADSLLFEILIDALTNQTKRKVPPPYLKSTATIFVKTGTYDEILPIVVPANVAVVGDELRSTVVRPAQAFYTETYSSSAVSNEFAVANTSEILQGMPVQFIGSRAFGDVVIGNTYWVYAVSTTGFSISETADLAVEKTIINGVGEMKLVGGMALSDMFYFQNGSGMRNLTLTGLGGTLSALNSYFTRRPTGGAYTSLDPGRGPDDTRSWIYRRSPYIQNVTTFGQGCVGCKIDGNLHNGGNRSIVSNDFTQILSDGIGVWCVGEDALTECVSVFSYYNYCGYLAEDGGRIRATNGNSSYGTFGVIAEGFVDTEVPITGNVFNRSAQIQASVQSSFGSNAQLVKVQYSNAGSEYSTQTTNLIRYSNDFVNNGLWQTDGNTTLFQNAIAPNGDSVAWTLNGLTSGTDSAYIFQNNAILPTGATYTGVAGTNISGSGINATFNIIVTSTEYIVSVNFGGSGYVVNNQILIPGLLLGGVSGVNDCIISVQGLSGSTITSVTATGTVPSGSTTNYVFSIHCKKSTAEELYLYAIFTGNNLKASGISFNFSTETVTKFSSVGGGNEPTTAGVVVLPDDWYRIWFVVNDADGLNDNLQYRVYPRGKFGNIGSTVIYGAQLTIGTSLTFYLETDNDRYTAYADYYITGAGINARAIGNEIRSGSIFQTRVLDLGLGVGGRGYLTASNNAQAGDSNSINLAGSDINTAANYIGLRLFVNSGTGAGQYGLISDFSEATKVAKIIKESFTPIAVTTTDDITDSFTIGAGQNLSTVYIGQPVQFVPTFYNTTVIASSVDEITVTESIGGIDSQLIIADTRLLKVNMAISFKGAVFGGVTSNFTYYVKEIIDSNRFTISTQLSGNIWPLNSDTGTMTLLFPSNTGFLTADTANMIVNQPISFTGAVIGGVTANTTYYINRIVDDNNFTISETLLTSNVSAANETTGIISSDTTNGFEPLNAVIFTGTSFGNIVPKQVYFISDIVSSTSFTITNSIIQVTATATAAISNLITVNSTTGFQADSPIKFSGNTFGNIVAEVIYYILAVNDATTFTVSAVRGGSTVTLTSAQGSVIARTPNTNTVLVTDAGSMLVTTTTANIITSKAEGTMAGTFYTSLFGGISRGTEYYILGIGTNTFTVTSTIGGTTPVQLSTDLGAMRVTASGWDHINPGTDISEILDSSTIYFIEPRITYEAPPFLQIAGGALPVLSPENYWKTMAYGNGYWLAFAESGTVAARTLDGLTWTAIQLTRNETWGDVAFGNNYWIAISDQGPDANSKALYSSSNGNGWREVDLPGNRSWSKVAYGNGTFVTIAKYVPEDVLGGVPAVNAAAGYSTNFGGTWVSASGLTATGNWIGLAYGVGTGQSIFVAITSGGEYAISTSGATWTVGTLPTPVDGAFIPSEIVYGNGRFVITTSGKPLYSLNGTDWKISNIEITADKISYGQGVFLAIDSDNGSAWISEDGFNWISQSVTNDQYNKVVFGVRLATNLGNFITIGELTKSSVVSAGATPKARANIVSGTIPTISMWETGSNYSTGSLPTIEIFDPNISIKAEVEARLGNGALGNPSWVNRGEGYNTTSTSIAINGDGFADQYQTGFTLIVNDLTKLPSPGDNLEIGGNSQVYKVTSAKAMFGTVAPSIEANLQISPELVVADSPAHDTPLTIRQKYSQVRLTNHDFLSIGFGNELQTNYPNTPEDTILAPQDQTVETNNGRVFYTSSDQDGNFKVGNLFAVEQATGIITISATQFGLSGLDELRLGGIAVGGSSVIIRQFSTDPTFVANSNEILSTQKAIKSYLSSRLSQGGSNTFTGELTAGTVKVGGPDKIQSTVPAGTPGSSIKIPVRASFQGPLAAVGGDAVALAYFIKTFWRR